LLDAGRLPRAPLAAFAVTRGVLFAAVWVALSTTGVREAPGLWRAFPDYLDGRRGTPLDLPGVRDHRLPDGRRPIGTVVHEEAAVIRRAFAVIALVLASACVTAQPPAGAPVPLSASFWRDTGARIGVAAVAFPKGTVHMVGPQDALDQAIANKKGERLVTYLEGLQPSEFTRVTAVFSSRLRAIGYAVTEIREPVDPGLYEELRAKGVTSEALPGLTALGSRYGVDRVLMLSVDRFGAYRDYFVFVPTEAPQAVFQVSGSLVDLRSTELLWRVAMQDKRGLVSLEGEWNQPPDYPNLTQAVSRAEHEAVVFIQNSFFAGAP
jgi:hypothetical protein